jgi:hypothetical protein
LADSPMSPMRLGLDIVVLKFAQGGVEWKKVVGVCDSKIQCQCSYTAHDAKLLHSNVQPSI